MKINAIRLFLTMIAFMIFTSTIFAADPPGLINYQGILRDSSDKPLNGKYDMIFTFFSGSSGGDEILIDQHLASGTGAVTVTDGMFNAWLGGGQIFDGSGPGTYTSLPIVFSNYSDVYLEIEIYNPDTTLWELLKPRIRIISAAYSLNADNLDGKNSLDFLDTSSTTQTKSGKIIFNTSTGDYGVEGYGPTAGGYFKDFNQSGYAYLGYGDYGIQAYGYTSGGYFRDSDHSSWSRVGYGDDGIQAYGNHVGGYFEDLDGSGYAYVGYGDNGISAYGNTTGGYFYDTDNSGYAYVGYGDRGIEAFGNTTGGYFEDLDGSGYAYVGSGHYGIEAFGNTVGGYFKDSNNSGYAYVGYVDDGIRGYGNNSGGYFKDADGSGYARVGYGDYGIRAYGNGVGGYFEDLNSSGYARVADGDYGISAYGAIAGGYFDDAGETGYAYVGHGDDGIRAVGIHAGGLFEDSDGNAYAYIAINDYSIQSYGGYTGGLFSDSTSTDSGIAYVGYGDRGIWAKGTFAGATFSHPNDTQHWADVSTPTRKIVGTGTVSFVQNHPHDKSKVITYAAPEGDEVAVYTRGTSRLINGEALVKLGESFSWVANPDIGLTAHITPRGEQVLLSVDSLTTSEMVVNGPEESNAVFDYIVFGLRIGFEELAIVQEKEKREAFLPALEDIQESYAQNPDLKTFNAFERFKRMLLTIGEMGEIDLTRSRQLVNAIDENKQEVLAKANEKMEMAKKQLDHRPEEDQKPMKESLEGIQQLHADSDELIDRAERTISGAIPMDEEGNIHAKSFRSVSPDLTGNVPISEPAEAGDILAIDPVNPGMMRLCDMAADQGVVGIVAGEPGVVLGGSSMKQIEELEVDQEEDIPVDESQEFSDELVVEIQQTHAPIALSGIVLCKVDAGYGPIQAGDLLTTSLTKGHAMRSDDHAAGTIVGKALEPLDAGTGFIKVLVMMR